jgi:hypothetical protein
MDDPMSHPVPGNQSAMSESGSATVVFRTRAKGLAALMKAAREPTGLWRPDELSAIFRHQMAAPVLTELGRPPGAGRELNELSKGQGAPVRTFSDLLFHPAPPMELLKLTKDFAKANMDHPESGLPSEIAAALYYLSIAAAAVRLDARISQLNEADLRRSLSWLKDQPWIDDKTRALLAAALEKLSQNGDRSRTMP